MKTSILKLIASVCLVLACIRSALVIAGDRGAFSTTIGGPKWRSRGERLCGRTDQRRIAMLTVSRAT